MSTRPRNLPGRLLILLMALVATFLLLGGTGAASAPTITMEHRVQSGDTLWDLADDLTAPGEDVREVIEVIRDLNHLKSANLTPGQILLIPVG